MSDPRMLHGADLETYLKRHPQFVIEALTLDRQARIEHAEKLEAENKALRERKRSLETIAVLANPPGCWYSPNAWDRNYTPGAIIGCAGSDDPCWPCKRHAEKTRLAALKPEQG